MLILADSSSPLGSLTWAPYMQITCHAYKVSKAALNMLNLQWAGDYGDKGFTFVAACPGVSMCHSRDLINADALLVAEDRTRWAGSRVGSRGGSHSAQETRARYYQGAKWQVPQHPRSR